MALTLDRLLIELRAQRRFDTETALRLKANSLNEYFSRCDLDAAVIGISGGVDSAVALGLLCYALQYSVLIALPLEWESSFYAKESGVRPR